MILYVIGVISDSQVLKVILIYRYCEILAIFPMLYHMPTVQMKKTLMTKKIHYKGCKVAPRREILRLLALVKNFN